ncbi:hypothetical protein ACHWQZ_G002270 [Mnemiopsis leidyi]
MSNADNAILPVTVVRGLNDKVYEKRKMAALEVERIVRELVAKNDIKQVRKVIDMLVNNFVLSQNPNAKKGGLIGVAAAAIALGKDIGLFVSEIVPPVLKSFVDVECRVRYFGCESMYNIAKVGRASMLLFFKEIFDGVSKLICDPDTHVKNGAELLDRLIKDIVTESNIFDVDLFVTLVRERIYTNNDNVRQYLVSWIQLLCSVPDIDLVSHLPMLLDGLFIILGDQKDEIRAMTQQVLNDFLLEINRKSAGTNFKAMIVVLLGHSKSSNSNTQLIALIWILRFLELDGANLTFYSAGILNAVLPCLSDQHNKTDIFETAARTKDKLLSLLTETQGTLKNMDITDMLSVLLAHIVPSTVYKDSTGREFTSPPQISVTTKTAVLQWVRTLHSHVPNKINSEHEDIFPAVIRTVSDPCDGVVVLSIQLLAAMCMQNSDQDKTNFENFLRSLIAKFRNDEKLLERRCSFIIQTLCAHVDSEKVFCTLARLLVDESDIVFTALLVQYLSWNLLTSPNLAPLRDTLKSQRNNPKYGKKGSPDGRAVFSTLYTTWCHDPVSTIALCMISHSYQHASDVIHALGSYEMTEMTLTGLDKLVQLLESPVFSALRLELVQPDTNPELFRSLAGILMLLPQSEAFTLLRNRLECVGVVRAAERTNQPSSDLVDEKTLQEMLDHFNEVQTRHAIKNLKLSEN